MLDYMKNVLDPPLRGKKIFFLHVPKCAGSAVNKSLVNLYKPWRAGQRHRVFVLREQLARDAEESIDVQPRGLREPLLAYLYESREIELIVGHFPFSKRLFDKHGDKWHFITMLRHPVDRWISHYYYNFQRPQKYEITQSIDEFARSERGRRIGTLAVSIFSEATHHKDVFRDDTIKTATENIKNFSIVGRSEYLQDFEGDFYNLVGTSISIGKFNIGEKRIKQGREGICDETMRIIKDNCGPDITLYENIFGKREK